MSSSHSTPSKSSKAGATKTGSKSKASSFSRSSRSSPRMFTPQMQDRQARNRDPFSSSEDSSDSAWEGQSGKFNVYGNDTYERVQKRREAAIVLDNPELLMMHAQARFDSIPGTRHYFTKILCGYEDEKDPYSVSMRNAEAARAKAKLSKDTDIAKGSL